MVVTMKKKFKKVAFLLAIATIVTSVLTASVMAIEKEENTISRKSGVEMFNDFIETFDKLTAGAILADEQLVYFMQRDEYWYPEDEDSTQPVRAITMPMTTVGYRAGDYYNHTTKNASACTCHATCTWEKKAGNNLTATDRCFYQQNGTWYIGICKKYNGAIQCAGFAYDIFNRYNNANTSSNHLLSKANTINNDSTGQTIIREYLSNIPIGSVVYGTLRNGIPHYFILAARTTSGATLYHANVGGACKIAYDTKSWATLANEYSSINSSFVYNKSHTCTSPMNNTWVAVGTSSICGKYVGNCIICNEYCTSSFDYYHNIPGGTDKCTKCGYRAYK
jgi:hypothetical protein